MRPFAVLNAIVFGSATAISFGLVAVLIIYLILQGRHPQLSEELLPLFWSSLQFLSLAGASGASLYATLKRLHWRWIAQIAMWFILAAIIVLYWPQ